MNREARRRLKLTKEERNLLDILSRWEKSPINISYGDRVKINFEQISGRPDYQKLTSNYREFVEKNKDTVFTAGNGLNQGKARNLMSFVEDDTWLFWTGDLIKI